METIQQSTLFQSFDSQYPGVELWLDVEYPYQESTYYWIVSKPDAGQPRNLAYVRVWKGRFQRQIEYQPGKDRWVTAK